MKLPIAIIAPVLGMLVAFGPGSSRAAGPDVGFVSLVRGKPVLQEGAGQRGLKLMQGLASGSVLTLDVADAVGFCHEPAATSYRLEGAGSVRINRDGITAEAGAPKILTVGRCSTTANSSETGGVLLRAVKPPRTP